jgi:peptidoglycan pentaglycine glycine transferase (the first glycine)
MGGRPSSSRGSEAKIMRPRLCDNPAEWNLAVLQLDGTLYQSWQWGELRRFHGWIPWRVLVEEGGVVRATVQVLERRAPGLPLSVLYAPRGIAHQGTDPRVLGELADWLRSFMRQRNAVFLRIDPGIADSNEQEKEGLMRAGFRALCERGSMWNLPRTTMVLDIRPSEEELFSAMRQTHRQLIRRAERRGVNFDCGSDVRHMREFYDLLMKTSQRQGFAVQGLDYFLRMQRTLLTEGEGLVFLARYEERAVAGVVCARFGRRCHYLYGGFDWEFRRAEANEALQWKAIRWAKDAGCRWYDTGGAGTGTPDPPREGNPTFGVYNYKKGFGAALCYSAGLFDLVNSRAGYEVFRRLERRAFPRAYRLAGTFLYKARNFYVARSSVKTDKAVEKSA